MMLKDIRTAYTTCEKCSSCSYVYTYSPNISSLDKLAYLVSKTCDKCGGKIGIESIKAKIVTKDLK